VQIFVEGLGQSIDVYTPMKKFVTIRRGGTKVVLDNFTNEKIHSQDIPYRGGLYERQKEAFYTRKGRGKENDDVSCKATVAVHGKNMGALYDFNNNFSQLSLGQALNWQRMKKGYFSGLGNNVLPNVTPNFLNLYNSIVYYQEGTSQFYAGVMKIVEVVAENNRPGEKFSICIDSTMTDFLTEIPKPGAKIIINQLRPAYVWLFQVEVEGAMKPVASGVQLTGSNYQRMPTEMNFSFNLEPIQGKKYIIVIGNQDNAYQPQGNTFPTIWAGFCLDFVNTLTIYPNGTSQGTTAGLSPTMRAGAEPRDFIIDAFSNFLLSTGGRQNISVGLPGLIYIDPRNYPAAFLDLEFNCNTDTNWRRRNQNDNWTILSYKFRRGIIDNVRKPWLIRGIDVGLYTSFYDITTATNNWDSRNGVYTYRQKIGRAHV
jgi:hypothetical protein